MKTPQSLLSERVSQALTSAFPDASTNGALVVPTQSAEHGDYQCNQALSMAKGLKTNPRAVATSVLEHLRVDDVCETPQIAGPGFINLRLRPDWVGERLRAMLADSRLGVDVVAKPRRVHIDFSSPNVAKPMHVGHIRSTVIGDVVTRVLRYMGHHVVSDNHLGDWGTQFGMMIVGYREHSNEEAFVQNPTAELTRVYRLVNERCERDAEYAEKVRAELVKLQAGDPENLATWKHLIEVSRREAERIYDRLDVHFDEWCGESFYNPMLAEVVDDLQRRGVARVDEGAVVVHFDDVPELRDRNLIIRKRDGAFLYASTDLASVKYRVQHHHADTIIYVTDGRQQLHFKQIIATARKWGYQNVDFVHVWFGTILGADNKPIKTRSGEPVELSSLLDEAEERAMAIVEKKNPELPLERKREVARVVGIAAVKYSDLSQDRTSDYLFSWERMMTLTGDSAPYLLYQAVRINSILTEAGTYTPVITLEQPEELALGKKLLRLADAVEWVLDGYYPHRLTTYLFELASLFSVFYEKCHVLKSEEPVRSSRLALCALTGRVLAQGLDLLGIKTLPRM